MRKRVENKDYKYVGVKHLSSEEELVLAARARKIIDVIRRFEEKYCGDNVSAEIRDLAKDSLTLRIREEIRSLPELMYVIVYNIPLNYCGIGPACVQAGLSEVVSLILDDPVASTIQYPMENMNLGMICASKGLIDETKKALSNKVASTQQDYRGNNMGLICAKRYFMKKDMRAGYESCVSLALDNDEASCQQNFNGENIGIVCAYNGIDSCVRKAISNITAFSQRDNKGNKMIDYWKSKVMSSKSLTKEDKRMLLCDFDDEMFNMLDK